MANAIVYGFHSLQDRFSLPVSGLDAGLIREAITQSMAEHNRQMDAFTGLFLRRGITDPTRSFQTWGTARLQPMDEFGRPIPIKAPGRYTVGFPLLMGASAIGETWLSAQKRNVEFLNNAIAMIQQGDMRWVFDHILAAMFNATAYNYFDEEFGTVSVQPIANGDSVIYQVQAGSDAGATDNHLLAQANAIGAGADNPFPAIYNELVEHPENGAGRVIVFVPSGLKASITALATFNPLPSADIQVGANTDVLVGSLGVNVPGTVLGMEDSGCWIVEWPRMVANYMVAIHTGGEPPIGERVDAETNLRGLVEVDPNDNFPWYQRNWLRRAGYGAWNRVGALVYRVGNGAYAVPTGYTSPMP